MRLEVAAGGGLGAGGLPRGAAQELVVPADQRLAREHGVVEAAEHADCPGRKPPILAVKRIARPCKSAKENRFTVRNAEAA